MNKINAYLAVKLMKLLANPNSSNPARRAYANIDPVEVYSLFVQFKAPWHWKHNVSLAEKFTNLVIERMD